MTKPSKVIEDRTRDPKEIREPLQCWRCGGPHMCKNFPLENEYVRKAHNIQGVEMVVQVARVVPRIYTALEDFHRDHQSTVVEVEVILLSNLFLF